MEFEAVVGLEIHVQLDCASKLFSRAPTSDLEPPSNHSVDGHCFALPGTLPVLNARAIQQALRLALALDSRIAPISRFVRKHYRYPDLPKGYQVTQTDEPLATGGRLPLSRGTVLRIRRVHVEEDAGRSRHHDGRTEVDLNRAGVALAEIVTEPDLRSGTEAAEALRELRAILVTIGVSDGRMEAGRMRCDANVSIRPVGQTEMGTRVEIKNVNGFRYAQQAIDEEAGRQIDLVRAGRRLVPQTRGFDAARRATVLQRDKESTADYRFFTDPDLPRVVVEKAWIATLSSELPELPASRRRRWQRRGLDLEAATTFAADPELAAIFEAALELAPDGAAAIGALLKTEVLGWRHGQPERMSRIDGSELARLARDRREGHLSSAQQKAILRDIMVDGNDVDAAYAAAGGSPVKDDAQLGAWVEHVIRMHPQEVATYRRGKPGLIGFFVGSVMRLSQGRADPAKVRRLLQNRLDGSAGP